MRRVLVAVALLALLVPAGFLGYFAWGLGLFAGTTEFAWKQKITVTVATPAGEVSGSAVQSVRIVKGNPSPHSPVSGSETYLVAEAVVVDLGQGGHLFALLGNAGSLLQGLVAPQYGVRWREALEAAQAVPQGTRFELAPDLYPLLVTFANIADPASVKRVDPNDLAASFGPGFALKSVTLEVTDEPVTTGRVEQVLGWRGKIPNDFWRTKLTHEQQDILSSVNWKRD